MNASEAFDQLVRAWRDAQVGLLIPLSHRCNASSCRILQLRGFACTKCGAGAAACCSSCVRVQDAFVCESTGMSHHCGTHCKFIAQHVCPITRIVHEPRNAPIRPYARAPADASRARTHRLCERTAAKQIIFRLLFSNARCKFEVHRRNMMRITAERAVHRYRRKQHAANKRAVYSIMVATYMQHYARCKALTHLRLAEDDQHLVCNAYAEAVHKLLSALRLETHARVDACIVVLLYFLRCGVVIRDEVFLEADAWMRASLPDAHAINNLLTTPVQFTSTRTQISKTLQEVPQTQARRLCCISRQAAATVAAAMKRSATGR